MPTVRKPPSGRQSANCSSGGGEGRHTGRYCTARSNGEGGAEKNRDSAKSNGEEGKGQNERRSGLLNSEMLQKHLLRGDVVRSSCGVLMSNRNVVSVSSLGKCIECELDLTNVDSKSNIIAAESHGPHFVSDCSERLARGGNLKEGNVVGYSVEGSPSLCRSSSALGSGPCASSMPLGTSIGMSSLEVSAMGKYSSSGNQPESHMNPSTDSNRLNPKDRYSSFTILSQAARNEADVMAEVHPNNNYESSSSISISSPSCDNHTHI